MKPMADLRRTVIIFDVPTYIDVNLLQCPPGFQWLKRRMVGKYPRPQLLAAVTGPVDSEVLLIGVGRKKVVPFVPEPDLCDRCSNWGHTVVVLHFCVVDTLLEVIFLRSVWRKYNKM